MEERHHNNLKKNKYHVPVQIIISKYTKRTTKRKNLDNPFLLESPKSKEFHPTDLEINIYRFFNRLWTRIDIINFPTWKEIKTLHPKLTPVKTASRLATAQGSTLTN